MGDDLKEWQIWYYFYQVCQGIAHLHENKIVHTDIKTQNILINDPFSKNEACITDYTLSNYLVNGLIRAHGEYDPYNKMICPPEFSGKEEYDERADVWELGQLLYNMYLKEYIIQNNKEDRPDISKIKEKAKA